MVEWDNYNSEQFKEVDEKYLPSTGEGDNMATQAVTAVNKLVYKWYNDGDVYDNTAVLTGWCNDLSSYANWLYKELGIDMLTEIFNITSDSEYEDLLWKLAVMVLDTNYLKEYESKDKVGSVYECSGPFQFIEEDDDWEW